MPQWDAGQYLKFEGERTQPVVDLINRIRLENPARIVDLGCGPGNSTAELRRRWPQASITGLDKSSAMIERARQTYPHERWHVADAATWTADEPCNLVFSNAVLHWLPDHERLCPRLLEQIAPGGALAVQVPAHYDSALHREILHVSRNPSWSDRMEAALRAFTHHSPEFYYDLLGPNSSHLDIWQTTYYHVLEGPESVLEWFRGSGLRPFLEALDSSEERQRFEALLLDRYTESYPRRPDGRVLFPFRRLFFVSYR
jgi:trans-aconitate 2-methyltransferase